MKNLQSKFFIALTLGFFTVTPFFAHAAVVTLPTVSAKFCAQLDIQKKEQLNKLTLGKKSILDQEAKAADAVTKRNDMFVASTTANLAAQKKNVESLLGDLSSIATTDEEIAIVADIQSTTTAALAQKDASTTATLASTTKIVTDATKKRGEIINNALTTYEQNIKVAYDNAGSNCATEVKISIANTKFDSETKTAKAELQKSELQAKIVTDNIELTYADAKLKLSAYDKDFAKVLNDVQTTIKKTFTEE